VAEVTLDHFPPPHRITLRDPTVKSDFVKWVQLLALESKYVCGLKPDGEADKRTMQEISEMLYRLGHPTYPAALSLVDGYHLFAYHKAGFVPNEWRQNRLNRMNPPIGPFQKGHGITEASWKCLHPGQFPPDEPDAKVVRPVQTLITPSGWGVFDPEGQGEPGHHWANDWFGVEAAGTAIVAPEAGVIERVTASSSNTGQVFGGVVSIRTEAGWMWVFRHVVPQIGLGTKVKPGDRIARIIAWLTGPDHTHVELYDESTRGDSRPYEEPPAARNPYEYLKKNGAI
jgi:murein DD-endopeptidase MepM/ murein hydrolase activator NlpD